MKTWIYHETEQPKIIDQKEYNSYKEDGWFLFFLGNQIAYVSTKLLSYRKQEKRNYRNQVT